jgi:hypothetical protein
MVDVPVFHDRGQIVENEWPVKAIVVGPQDGNDNQQSDQPSLIHAKRGSCVTG